MFKRLRRLLTKEKQSVQKNSPTWISIPVGEETLKLLVRNDDVKNISTVKLKTNAHYIMHNSLDKNYDLIHHFIVNLSHDLIEDWDGVEYKDGTKRDFNVDDVILILKSNTYILHTLVNILSSIDIEEITHD
ncbi:hypothetical protein [Marinobacter salarius]|uniref:hypothetical protein n=1 Tax=Marinobacter salarius TaxID=1420917 RepID=UPI003BACA55A